MKKFLITAATGFVLLTAPALAQDHSAGHTDITYGTGNLSPGQGARLLAQCDVAATPANPVTQNGAPYTNPTANCDRTAAASDNGMGSAYGSGQPSQGSEEGR